MTHLFADTFYFLALINVNDRAHQKAKAYSENQDSPLITSAWVLTELADGLCRSSRRGTFRRMLNILRNDPENIIVEPSQSLFDAGIELYNARPDKDWSLTDCISFVVMRQNDLVDALTGDHHFEQAGFNALLK